MAPSMRTAAYLPRDLSTSAACSAGVGGGGGEGWQGTPAPESARAERAVTRVVVGGVGCDAFRALLRHLYSGERNGGGGGALPQEKGGSLDATHVFELAVLARRYMLTALAPPPPPPPPPPYPHTLPTPYPHPIP